MSTKDRGAGVDDQASDQLGRYGEGGVRLKVEVIMATRTDEFLYDNLPPFLPSFVVIVMFCS